MVGPHQFPGTKPEQAGEKTEQTCATCGEPGWHLTTECVRRVRERLDTLEARIALQEAARAEPRVEYHGPDQGGMHAFFDRLGANPPIKSFERFVLHDGTLVAEYDEAMSRRYKVGQTVVLDEVTYFVVESRLEGGGETVTVRRGQKGRNKNERR